MDKALATLNKSEIIERVLISGDLSKLTPQERTSYYMHTCESLSLNPMTRPFEYITLNGKLTLYARKDCADQLRKRDNISIGKPDITFQDDLIIVSVEASDANGRRDSDVGVVKKTDMQGNAANSLMKAVTKAKRRVTLSICGLGMLDETEVETIPGASKWEEPEAPTAKSKMWARWYELSREAIALKLIAPSLDDAADDATIISEGKKLRAAIDAAKAQPE